MGGFGLTAGLLLLATAASGGDAGTRFADPQFGYVLTAPAGWTRKTDIPRPYVAFLGPVEAGFQTNVNVYTEPAANKTLKQYVRAAREAIARNKAMRLQSSGPAVLGGTPAAVLQSMVKLPGQSPSVSRQVVAVRGGRGYMVTLTVPPSSLKKYLPTFGKVVSSFHWQR